MLGKISPERGSQPDVAGGRPAVAQPPRVILGDHQHPRRVIPPGTGPGRPQPNTPESTFVDPAQVAPQAGQFTYFKNTPCRPALTATQGAVEPCAAINRDTMLVTGNWFAGLSKDGGQTFSDLNPYTFFPALDSGFCCDQRVDYVASHDLTVWYQQYQYSATTSRGSIRVAVASGRDRLRSGLANDWTRYVFDPQQFGYSSDAWFDFPDTSYTDAWFYWTSNVYLRNSNGSNSPIGAVCVRMDLADMQAGNTVTYASFRGDLAGNGGGMSWRLANGGTGAPMFWADTTSTTNIRIWRWQTGGSIDYVDRSVATYSAAQVAATTADGRLWLGNATGRIRGAWGQSGEIGFLWTCAPQAGRPNAYVRVARFTTPARDMINEHDIWSSTNSLGFGAAEANTLGHVGIVIARGSLTTFPHGAATIVDGYQPWGSGFTFTTMANGSAGPTNDRWGDYFDVQRHWQDQRTFLGTGMQMTSASTSSAQIAWFGRDDYQPVYTSLDVTSTGASGVPITVDVTGRSGNKDGVTPFSRTYDPRQGYQLTAPLTHTVGGQQWVFERWAYTLTPGGTVRLHTLGDRVLTVDDLSGSDDTAEARYVAVRRLDVGSFNPASGVTVDVATADVNGLRDGTTPFVRNYGEGTVVQLTAPDRGASQPFRRWQRGNGTFNTNRSISLTIGNANESLVAQYWTYTQGSIVSFGSGCPGTNNNVPGHRVLGTPEIGQTLTYEGRHVPSANLFGIIHLGQRANPPIPLAVIGMGTCTLNIDPIAFNVPGVFDAAGQFSLPLVAPNDINLIGASLASQVAAFDPGTATTFKWVESAGVEVTLGGLGY